MKKILIIFLFCFFYIFAYAEVNILNDDKVYLDTNVISLIVEFNNYYTTDTYGIYINNELKMTDVILQDTYNFFLEIDELKDNIIEIINFSNGIVIGSDSIFCYYYPETLWSLSDSIYINRLYSFINILNDSEVYLDTNVISLIVEFNNYRKTDTYGIYINNELKMTDVILQDTYNFFLEIDELKDNIIEIINFSNGIVIGSDSIFCYYYPETLWSITDSIYISDKDKILDYYRFKKILQNDINKIKIYNWFKISELTNDDYYREPNIPYKKFRKIIGY